MLVVNVSKCWYLLVVCVLIWLFFYFIYKNFLGNIFYLVEYYCVDLIGGLNIGCVIVYFWFCVGFYLVFDCENCGNVF